MDKHVSHKVLFVIKDSYFFSFFKERTLKAQNLACEWERNKPVGAFMAPVRSV